MTRIAAGSPAIWPDICEENSVAITGVIGALIAELSDLRDVIRKGDGASLLETLERAHRARRNLPSRVVRPSEVAEVRVPVPDRQGVLAEVTTLASELGVNIADLEIAHSSEGDAGVLILLVDVAQIGAFQEGLTDRGYRPAVRHLE